MKLPNARLAIVDREKIAQYLLNPTHRYGASKARFFAEFGFRLPDWEALAQALLEHGQRFEISLEQETGFGPRYEVDGPLDTPDGRAPRVRTVWQLDHGQLRRGSSPLILWSENDDQRARFRGSNSRRAGSRAPDR